MTDAVVVQTAWLGDAVLTTPLLAALARRHGPVDVVTTPDAAPLLATHPAVARVIAWQKRGALGGLVRLARMAGRLRARRYQSAYLPHRSVRTSVLAALAAIPRRVGFADAPALARACYTELRPRSGAHETERLLHLADPAAFSMPSLALTDADRAAAAAVLARAGMAADFVVLAPGSARATKRWPHYRALAERLRRTRAVLVVGALADAGLLDGTAGPHPLVDTAGRLMVRETVALIARAALVVCNDSFALHAAQAVGTPVLAIFGPTAPSLGFGPRGVHDATVGLELACRPCSTHGGAVCPLGHHRCMRELSAERVALEAEALLARVAVRAARA